jgi:hypothetical protein
MIAVVAEKSGNAKLSKNENVSATWVPQVTCHSDCPLKKNGCYAEIGRAGIHTHRLNAKAYKTRKGEAALRRQLAKEEAKQIRGLTGTRKLRVHVVGDCATADSARIVGRAMVAHQKKYNKSAWTYTHSFRRISKKSWAGANVLASCETPADVELAKKRGYAAALVVPPHPTHKTYQHKGITVIPCPAQFFRQNGERHTTCEHCAICQNPDMLYKTNRVVGFQPDGVTTKRVLTVLHDREALQQADDSSRRGQAEQ